MATQRVVITGGQGDLAGHIAKEFVAHGDEVAAPGRSELDVTSGVAVDEFFRRQPCDLLVCCAGNAPDVLMARMSEDQWDLVWEVNYQGARRCAEAAFPWMQRMQCGHIVFISSHSAIHPPVGQVHYASAKAALLGLTRDLADRYGPSNVRVNAIFPGFLENRMTSLVTSERKETVRNDHALGRFNSMDRVASFIRFLHHELIHTSGQVFQLDSRKGHS